AALDNLISTDHDINLALLQQSHNERLQNRARLRTILDICLFLARQGLPFRGGDEKDSSSNRGNFLELIRFTAERVPDFSLQMANAGYNAKYTSPSVQRQLLHCAATAIRQHIVLKELEDIYFSLLVDEASCDTKSEQMAVVIRFVSKTTGIVLKRFMG
ncbi:hypothetical protein GN958_ATG21937, partial [Phytophthora infestans]